MAMQLRGISTTSKLSEAVLEMPGNAQHGTMQFDSLTDDSGIEDSTLPTLNREVRCADPIKAISGTIDERIRFLSFSSRLTLHGCPRKFQLYRLRAAKATASEEDSLTFSFGHVVGEGIQLALQKVSEKKILWRMFTMWHAPLFARDDKRKKSFSEAVQAVRKFINLRAAGYLDNLELVYVPSPNDSTKLVPACELGFTVTLHDGFIYRGFVDAVLRDRDTGEIIVLECKTTWYKETSPAEYKNSSQGIGYSIVLDSIFPGLSSYSVLYLVYSTTTGDFTPFPFPKSFSSRAEWIRSLVLDVDHIVGYEEAGIYPKHGEYCRSYFKDCEYLNTCNTSTGYLIRPLEESREEMDADMKRYNYNFNIVDLIDRQITRNESEVIS